jgi:hypothetical protein
MSVVVRPCADRDELDHAFMMIGQYFGMEPGAGESAMRFVRVLPVERMLAAWDGDTIVGGTGSLPIRLSVPVAPWAVQARPLSASHRHIAARAWHAR